MNFIYGMKARFAAFGVHLLCSLIVAGLLLLTLYYLWFPSPLMSLGGIQGIKLILIIDIILGPVCTFMVFNVKKSMREKCLDLTLIIIVQLAAMLYGVWMVYSQKPLYIVSSYEGFYVVSKHEYGLYIDNKGGTVPERILEETVKYQGAIPIVYLDEPESEAKRAEAMFNFEFQQLVPLVFNWEEYKTVENLEHIPSIMNGQFEKNSTCYVIPISSAHGSLDACLIQEGRSIEKN